MEDLIRKTFTHVDTLSQHVFQGHYDLIGPNGEIMLPQVWETMVKPGWSVIMKLWPMPEKPPVPGRPPGPPRMRSGSRRNGPLPPPLPTNFRGVPPPPPPNWTGGPPIIVLPSEDSTDEEIEKKSFRNKFMQKAKAARERFKRKQTVHLVETDTESTVGNLETPATISANREKENGKEKVDDKGSSHSIKVVGHPQGDGDTLAAVPERPELPANNSGRRNDSSSKEQATNKLPKQSTARLPNISGSIPTVAPVDQQPNQDDEAGKPTVTTEEILNEWLVRGYMSPRNGELPSLQPRRSLDQYFYTHLESTSQRDGDQVVCRYTRKMEEPKMFMVDQLWLWILNDGQYLTYPIAFKEPRGC
jgi:hypothetical protein